MKNTLDMFIKELTDSLSQAYKEGYNIDNDVSRQLLSAYLMNKGICIAKTDFNQMLEDKNLISSVFPIRTPLGLIPSKFTMEGYKIQNNLKEELTHENFS